MSDITFYDPYHPKNPETGESLPLCRAFVVNGIGFGTVAVYHPKDGEVNAAGGQCVFAEIEVTFTRPWTENHPDGEVTGFRYLDSNHSSASVVGNLALLEPLLRDNLAL